MGPFAPITVGQEKSGNGVPGRWSMHGQEQRHEGRKQQPSAKNLCQANGAIWLGGGGTGGGPVAAAGRLAGRAVNGAGDQKLGRRGVNIASTRRDRLTERQQDVHRQGGDAEPRADPAFSPMGRAVHAQIVLSGCRRTRNAFTPTVDRMTMNTNSAGCIDKSQAPGRSSRLPETP